MVMVAPGLSMPREVVVTDEVNGFAVEMTVTFGDYSRVTAESVRVTRLPGGPAVTAAALRSIPIARLTKMAIQGAILKVNDRGGYVEYQPQVLTPEFAARLRENGPTTETLEWVTHIYRVALLVGDPPTKSVETVLEIPRSTAGRWIAAARERGLLGKSEGPGKAGSAPLILDDANQGKLDTSTLG
jgi:hypothetical protein